MLFRSSSKHTSAGEQIVRANFLRSSPSYHSLIYLGVENEMPQNTDLDSIQMYAINPLDSGTKTFIQRANCARVNELLVSYGYLGTSPTRPQIAISLHVLEDFRQTHRVCPRFSIQTMVKKICHILEVRSKTFSALER